MTVHEQCSSVSDAELPTERTLPTAASAKVFEEHEHCACVERLQASLSEKDARIADLEEQVFLLEEKNKGLAEVEKEYTKMVMSLDRIKDNDKLVCFYTGFRSIFMLMACFNFLEPSAKVSIVVWKVVTS